MGSTSGPYNLGMALITSFAPPFASPLAPGTTGNAGATSKVGPFVSGHQCSGHHHHDTVVLNGNSAASGTSQLRALQQDVARRTATDAQVNRMMVTQGSASATPEDATKIRDELSRMDPGVLKALADRGTTIRVLGQNENLYDAGLLRPISQQDFQRNLASDKANIAGAQSAVSNKYDAAIRAAEAQVAKLSQAGQAAKSGQAPQSEGLFGGFGGFGGQGPFDPKLSEAQAEVQRLKALREKELATGIREASDGRWAEFNAGALATAEKKSPSFDSMFGGAGMADAFRMQNDMLSRTASLDQMASAHGLKDPAQAKAFKDQVVAMNQGRIDQLRQSSLAQLTENARGTGEVAEHARKTLAEAKANPSSLPLLIGPDERPLLVPNQFATTVQSGGKDQSAAMTLHDVSTYHNWRGEDGQSSNPMLLGQFFYENGRSEVLVRREQLGLPASAGYTLTHEVGHAVEEALKVKEPKFYESFDQRLRDSHETATPFGGLAPQPMAFGAAFNPTASNKPRDPNRQAVSSYAETNSHEFFAEGYAAFVHDPERLKATDARLYSLIAEGNKALGGR